MRYSNPMNPMFSPQVSLLPQQSMLGPYARELMAQQPGEASGGPGQPSDGSEGSTNPLFHARYAASLEAQQPL